MLGLIVATGTTSGCDRAADAPQLNPDDPIAMRATITAIESSLQSARFSEALRIATRLTEVAPQSCEAFELLGRVEIALSLDARAPLAQQTARNAAAAAYKRAVELCAPSAGLLNAAGVAAQSADDLAGAVGFFARARELDPTNPQHPLFQGLALMQMSQFDAAGVSLARARALDPQSPWVVAALSGLALQQGDAPRALELAREARLLDPRSDELRIAEAKALRKLARHQEVLTLLLALPERARLTEAIAWEIAAAHESMGDPTAAAEAWAKWAEFCGTAESALDAARRWTLAKDPIQAQTWSMVARQRGAR
ncbi:MAG: hypothetical protein EXS01_00885 [Phycisphaerales bacterium]|nr:hypothetical protein [Phycisphaerales bacterium]